MCPQCKTLWQLTVCESNVFLQSYNKADTPIKGVDNVDASLPAVSKVDTATPTVSTVDASCQVDDPTEMPIEGIRLLY